MTSANDNTFAHQMRPYHHLHTQSEALPGVSGAAPAADYSTEVTNDSNVWKDTNERRFGADTDTNAVMAGGQHSTTATHTPGRKGGVFGEGRPLGVQPTSQGQ